MYPIRIFDALQGFIEYGAEKNPCYLFNGIWYVFDSRYSDLLNEEYGQLYEIMLRNSTTLLSQYGLKLNAASEEKYNALLRDNTKIVVAHKAILDNVEVADAIFWDDDNIYLMHNKDSFSGLGARDLTNQVLTSAEYLQHHNVSFEWQSFLQRYYDAILSNYEKNGSILSTSVEDFKSAFDGKKKIHYVLGYLDKYCKNSRSTYAKYLTIDIVKKLSAKGYSCTVMNVK